MFFDLQNPFSLYHQFRINYSQKNIVLSSDTNSVRHKIPQTQNTALKMGPEGQGGSVPGLIFPHPAWGQIRLGSAKDL